MIIYIIRRLLFVPVQLAGVSMLIFAMLSMLSPSERVSLYVSDVPKRQASLDALVEKYGLDEPIPLQYWHWLVGQEDRITGEIEGGILRGDLGWSVTARSSVTEVIRQRFPATAELPIWLPIGD